LIGGWKIKILTAKSVFLMEEKDDSHEANL